VVLEKCLDNQAFLCYYVRHLGQIDTNPMTDTVDVKEKPLEPVKRGRGRPKKSEVEARKKGNRGKVGRPAGDAARINEFKARILATAGDRVIDKIINIAMNDEHPGQMAALKMCMDRVLPMSYFEKDKMTGGRNSVSITITGIGGDTTVVGTEDNEDVIEGEVVETIE
jgi:hypothetical protein